jgi:hypothetical protein
MIAEWLDFLRQKAPDWNLPAGDKWTCLFHNNYHPHCKSINLLWFYEDAKFPGVVAKLYREPEILQREFANLKAGFAASPRHVPRPLHLGPLGDYWTLWMEGVPGYQFRPEAVHTRGALRSVVDATISIHSGLQTSSDRPDPARWQRMVADPLNTVSRFGSSALIQERCSSLASSISPDWLMSLPTIPQHGDLFLGNILCHRGVARIVDWESFGFVDLPLYDLITFCFSLLRGEDDRAEPLPRWAMNQMPPLIGRYCKAVGLDNLELRWLVPLSLMNWFQLQWSEGKREFSQGLYRFIEDYFRRPERWEAFLAAAESAGAGTNGSRRKVNGTSAAFERRTLK